jgi:protein-S-isoprenylcysteine O-methyltransferase Ste14
MNPKIPPPLIVALLGAAMWAANRALPATRFEWTLPAPVAMTLLAAGLLLAAAAIVPFVRARTTINPLTPARASHLITGGVFAYSRNPIYLADALILAAWAAWLGNVVNLLFLWIFFWAIQRWQIIPEERALQQIFGERYAAYCARVRRWL